MKKLLFVAIAASFAFTAFAQDNKPAEEKAAVPDDKVVTEAKKQEAEEARRAAAATRAAEEKDRREQLMKACIIKPVMTDDEIEACKKAYRA